MNGLDNRHLPTVQKLLSSTLPERLYHYTDNHGILGIMKSKNIWATEARYLNDQMEIEKAKKYVQLFLSNLRSNSSTQFSPDEVKLLEVLEHEALATRPGVCVASFSEDRDQLAQWRAYGGEGSFCLDLSSRLLQECAVSQDYVLGRCVYTDEEAYTIASEIVDGLFGSYRQSEGTEDDRKRLGDQIQFDITHYGPLLKDQSFAQEREWRIVTPQIHIGDKRLDFRASRGRILPFVSVDIESCLRGEGGSGGAVVHVGPGIMRELDFFPIQALTQGEIGRASLGRSSSSFRVIP